MIRLKTKTPTVHRSLLLNYRMTDWADMPPSKPETVPADKLPKRSTPPSSSQNTPKEISPEPYNSSEVLSFLSDQYNTEINAAKQDKAGHKYRIYRSLDSSSSWSTKTTSSGKRSIQNDEFNLLREINRELTKRSQRPRKST